MSRCCAWIVFLIGVGIVIAAVIVWGMTGLNETVWVGVGMLAAMLGVVRLVVLAAER